MGNDLIDSMSLFECVNILKNAHPEQTHHRIQDGEPERYRKMRGKWLFMVKSDQGWTESAINYGDHDALSTLIALSRIRAKCRAIIENAPPFVCDVLNQPEAMYNSRTGHYVVRGLHSALVECEGDYYRSTMPYHSSFYSECVYLKDLIEVTTLQHVHIESVVIA